MPLEIFITLHFKINWIIQGRSVQLLLVLHLGCLTSQQHAVCVPWTDLPGLLLLHCQLYLWGSPFFFFCIASYICGLHRSSSSSVSTSYISGVHHSSSSALPAISVGFTILLLLLHLPAISVGFNILLLLLHCQLFLWGSPFFFFCISIYICGVHHSSSASPNYISEVHHSSSSALPAISVGFTVLLLLHLPAISLGFTILLLHCQLYLWASPFFFFFCISQLYLWGSTFFFFFFCIASYIYGVHHSSSALPAISVGFTILLLLLLPAISLRFTILLLLCSQLSLGFTVFLLLLGSQPYLWGSQFFFFFCVPSYICGVHHFSSSSTSPSYISGVQHSSSSSAFPSISVGFTILLLLRSQLYLWGSPFFFFCVPSNISGVHHSSSSVFPAISWVHHFSSSSASPSYISGVHHSSSSSASPSYICGVHHSSSSVFPAISLRFTILLLLRCQLYLWGLPFFFFFCIPSCISGVHHFSSFSSAMPAIYVGFTILLLFLLCCQLYLWGSPFFFFSFSCVPSYISGVHKPFSAFPSYISGVHHSFPACQLYFWGSPFFFFFCIASYISWVHHSSSSSSSSAFPAISLGLTILCEIFTYVTIF